MHPTSRASRLLDDFEANNFQLQYLRLFNKQDLTFNTNGSVITENSTSDSFDSRVNTWNRFYRRNDDNTTSTSEFTRNDILNDMNYFWNVVVPAVAMQMYPTRQKSGVKEFELIIEY